MANIGINIQTNFDEAGKQLQAFTGLTDKETKRVQASLKRIESFEADSFVQQNKRIALSVQMTKGSAAALATEHQGLERKIQMLIRNGIDPEAESLKKLQAEYRRTGIELSRIKKEQTDMKGAFTSIAIAAAGFGFALNGAIRAASDLEEATGKFNVVFGGVTRDVSKDVDMLKKSYAMSTREARQNLASMQDLLVPMGMNKNAAADMSANIVRLAADLGSFNNVKTADVMRDLQAALTGSGETMKKYGVVLNQTDVQQKALSMGLAKNAKDLTAADKAQAAYSIIVSGSSAAIGDMARTSNSYANQQKAMRAQMEDFAASAGKTFIPIAKTIVGALSSIMKVFNGLSDEMRSKIVTIASIAGGLMLVAKASTMMGGSFVGALNKVKAAMTAHPLLLLVGIGASLVTIFSSAGKSAADFESDLKGAEDATKKLNAELTTSKTAFDVFEKGINGAAEGSALYKKQVEILLQKNPDLVKMGITTASSFKQIEEAQRSLTEAKQADATIKAAEQYKKLKDNLGELRASFISAFQTFKSDPTKENLAIAQKYRAMLARSGIAMQNLGNIAGKSLKDIKTDMQDAGTQFGAFRGGADLAADALQEFGKTAAGVFKTFEEDIKGMNRTQLLFARKSIEMQIAVRKAAGDTTNVITGQQSIQKIDALLAKMDSVKKKQQQMRAGAGGKVKDLTGEIQSLEDANMLRNSFEDKFDRKRAKLYLDFHRKEQQLIADNAVSRAQRIQYVRELEIKLLSDVARVNDQQQKKISNDTVKAYQDQVRSIMGGKGTTGQKLQALQAQNQAILSDEKLLQEARIKLTTETEKQITRLKEQEEKIRLDRMKYYSNFSLQSIGSMIKAVSSLYAQQSTSRIAAMDAAFQAELDSTSATDSEKEKMQKAYEKKKAKIEYDAAMKSWRLSLAAGVVDGARAILSALNTKPFIPAGIAAGAVATALTGIQLATLKASKPTMSAESGGNFVVPGNPESSRGDSQLMRVNPGENVSVTPRGESGSGRSLTVVVQIDRRTLYKTTQEGIDSGEITLTNANLVPA